MTPSRGRAALVGAAVALASFAAVPSAHAAPVRIDDPAGDTTDLDGAAVDDPGADIVGVEVDLTGDTTVVVELAAADADRYLEPMVVLASPYGGRSFLVAGVVLDGEPRASVQDPAGERVDCPGATVTGARTARVTYSVPDGCIDLPDQVVVLAVGLGREGSDVAVDHRRLVPTGDAGDHSRFGVLDGDPATTDRLGGDDPVRAAVAIGRARFPDGGALTGVVARPDVFADAMAGAPLLGDAPLLFTGRDSLDPVTRAELVRAVRPGGEVQVLGGTRAISDAVVAEIEELGFPVVRLAGVDRMATSTTIARSTITRGPEVLLVRAAGPAGNPNGTAAWADAIAAGAYSAEGMRDVLLVAGELSADQVAFLQEHEPERVVAIGGTAAVPDVALAQVRALGLDVIRVAGTDRSGTARAVWEDLRVGEIDLGEAEFVAARYDRPRGAFVLDGFDPQAWALGLAAAPVLVAERQPLVLLHGDAVPEASVDMLAACRGVPEVEAVVLGGPARVSPAAVSAIESLDPTAC